MTTARAFLISLVASCVIFVGLALCLGVAHAEPPTPTSTLQPVPGPVAAPAPVATEQPSSPTAPVAAQAATTPPAPAEPAPALPWELWLLIGLAAINGAERMLGGLRILLGVIAPRTKTTADDKLLAVVGKLDDAAIKIRDALGGLATAPATATASPPTVTETSEKPTAPNRVANLGGLLALLIAGASLQPGCAAAHKAPAAAGHALGDCAKADALPIAVLVAAWAVDAVIAGRVNWQSVEAGALAQGKVIGYCAAGRFVAAMSAAPTPAGLLPALDPGKAMLERLRAHWSAI
jgi:hypothetical protein